MKKYDSAAFVATLQDVLLAPTPEQLQKALQELGEWVFTQPVSLIRTHSEQFRDLIELHLIEAVRDSIHALPEERRRVCFQALEDYDGLYRPVFPALITGESAHKLWERIEKLFSLDEYDKLREDILNQLQSMNELERETVSGHLDRRLADMLISETLTDAIRLKARPTLERQFRLWHCLSICERYGLEQLALYFLRAKGNLVEVMLPFTMADDIPIEDLYAAARVIAVLSPQIGELEKRKLEEQLCKKAGALATVQQPCI